MSERAAVWSPHDVPEPPTPKPTGRYDVVDFPENALVANLYDSARDRNIGPGVGRFGNKGMRLYAGAGGAGAGDVLDRVDIPAPSLASLTEKAKAAGVPPDRALLSVDEAGGGNVTFRELGAFKSDAEIKGWLSEAAKGYIEDYLGDRRNWTEERADRSAAGPAPSLEDLMGDLEQRGLEKYASLVKEVAASLPPLWTPPARRPRGRGAPPGREPREVPYGAPMLRRGEPYTEIEPGTGRESPATYSPRVVGVLVSDYLTREMQRETDPERKRWFRELIDAAKAGEVSPAGRQAAEGKHWLSQPSPAGALRKGIPARADPTLRFLESQAMSERDTAKRDVIYELIDKYERGHKRIVASSASSLVRRCAANLRGRGYEALASRLEGKVAAGIFRQGDGVRIKSLPEHIADSKAEVTNTKNLFDEMYDKYIRVFEGAAALLRKAKADMQDPSDLEEAVREVMIPSGLMMQKLLEVGEVIKGGQR